MFRVKTHPLPKPYLPTPEFEAFFTEAAFCQHELTETIRI
jgi:hypothetical protein